MMLIVSIVLVRERAETASSSYDNTRISASSTYSG
jgi:hypothetical protein